MLTLKLLMRFNGLNKQNPNNGLNKQNPKPCALRPLQQSAGQSERKGFKGIGYFSLKYCNKMVFHS